MDTKTLTVREWLDRKDDPWRLVCPECGCTTVQSRTSAKMTVLETHYQHEKAMFENGVEYSARYHCKGCNENYEYLLDQKTGEHVRKKRTPVQ